MMSTVSLTFWCRQRFALEGFLQTGFLGEARAAAESEISDNFLGRRDGVFIGRTGSMDFEMLIGKYFFDVSKIPSNYPSALISLPQKPFLASYVTTRGSREDCTLAATHFTGGADTRAHV